MKGPLLHGMEWWQAVSKNKPGFPVLLPGIIMPMTDKVTSFRKYHSKKEQVIAQPLLQVSCL